MRLVRLVAPLLLTLVAATSARAQGIAIPFGLQGGVPQGEFAQNVNFAGGVGGGLLWKLGGVVGLRADLNVMLYGSETRRVPLGGGALGLINVDVTTTNSIVGGNIGGQIGVPGDMIMPYVGGMIGFSAFTTQSRVEGSNSTNQPFAESTNSNDAVFSRTAMAGLYFPIGAKGTVLDLGVRHVWNGEKVRYLTQGDITEDISGDVTITPRETRADLLVFVIGLTFTPGGAK